MTGPHVQNQADHARSAGVSGWRLDVLLWIGVLAVAGVAAATEDVGATIDTPYFLHASQTLLSGRWLDTFADPGLQAGPLQVAAIGAAGRLGEAVGLSALRGVCILQSVVLTALVMIGAAVVADNRRRSAVAVAGLVALATGTIWSAYFYGHPAEVVNPVLWVLAALAARAGRPWAAGVLVGTSAGFETWGVLGLAVLLLDRRRGGVRSGVVAALVVVAATYGPFALFGSFAMFDYHWTVSSGSLPAALGFGPTFGWPLRAMQAGLAGFAGAAVSLLFRRHRSACLLAAMAILAVKVGLDPGRGAWYLLGLQTIALLGAAHVIGSTWPQRSDRPRDRAEERGVSMADHVWISRG